METHAILTDKLRVSRVMACLGPCDMFLATPKRENPGTQTVRWADWHQNSKPLSLRVVATTVLPKELLHNLQWTIPQNWVVILCPLRLSLCRIFVMWIRTMSADPFENGFYHLPMVIQGMVYQEKMIGNFLESNPGGAAPCNQHGLVWKIVISQFCSMFTVEFHEQYWGETLQTGW